jgi:hypothetical protein
VGLDDRRRIHSARTVFERALRVATALHGADDPRTAQVEGGLAGVLAGLHATREAIELMRHVVGVRSPEYVAQSEAELAELDGDRALAQKALDAWRGKPLWNDRYNQLTAWLATAR